MKIRVLFFSVLRDLTGLEEADYEVEESATVSDVLQRLYGIYPELVQWDERLLVAVDCDYAERSTSLKEGAELALFPPVQGG